MEYASVAFPCAWVVSQRQDRHCSLTGVPDLTVLPGAVAQGALLVAATNAMRATSNFPLPISIFPQVLFVDASAAGTGTGLSWTDDDGDGLLKGDESLFGLNPLRGDANHATSQVRGAYRSKSFFTIQYQLGPWAH